MSECSESSDGTHEFTEGKCVWCGKLWKTERKELVTAMKTIPREKLVEILLERERNLPPLILRPPETDVCYICGRKNGEKLVIMTDPERKTVIIMIRSPTNFMRDLYPMVGICQICDLLIRNVAGRTLKERRELEDEL